MLNSDKLVFIELQKTGSTGLKKFLGNIVGGESTGKTAAYADELLAMGKPIVGLVCHPLIWYLDQWRQGCGGKGEIYKHLVDEKRWNLLRTHAAKPPAKNPAKAKDDDGDKARQKDVPAQWGPEYAKSRWYGDVNDAEAFREWLRAVALHPGLRNLIARGYKVSRIGKLAGLMTYQYVVRFLRDGENIERSVDTLDALDSFMHERAITTHFLRAEHAGEDLLKVLDELGIELTPEQREQATAFKRRGADNKLIRKFYDAASLRLVAEREQLMGKLFGYDLESAVAAAPAGKTKAAKAANAGGAKAKAKEARDTAGGEDRPKLSKEERVKKREARVERRAAKGAKKDEGETPADDSAAPDPAPKAPPKSRATKSEKPTKVKRVKNRPVDDDVVETEA